VSGSRALSASPSTTDASAGTIPSSKGPVRTAAAPLAPPPTPVEIRRAAALTAAEPGFRAEVSARITVAQLGGNPLSAVGSGYFDPSTDSGTLALAVTLPGLLSLAGPLPAQVVLAGGEAYVRVPAALASELATREGWLGAGLGSLGLGDSLSPAEILREVARDATTSVPDQHAHVAIDPHTGLVRTIVLTYSRPGSYRLRVRLLLTGFSRQSASPAPPAAQTGSLTTALKALGF
jgi:hypothetical protein